MSSITVGPDATLAVKSSLSVCAREAASPHFTLMFAGYWTWIGVQTICDVSNHAPLTRLLKSEFQ